MVSTHTTPSPVRKPAHHAGGNSRFKQQLATFLHDRDPEQPAALVHLELSRAQNILQCCGRERDSDLCERVLAQLPVRRAGKRVDPMMVSAAGKFTLLLENCTAEDAVVAARRLCRTLDGVDFRWHEHSFRLGAHVGVVELAPAAPASPGLWLQRAREACSLAQEMGGTGVTLLRHGDLGLREVQREREWREHLCEIIA